jgi:hypothetical protein
VPEAYQERWERMLAVKSHYDPANFFRMNQNVQPRNLNGHIGQHNTTAKEV